VPSVAGLCEGGGLGLPGVGGLWVVGLGGGVGCGSDAGRSLSTSGAPAREIPFALPAFVIGTCPPADVDGSALAVDGGALVGVVAGIGTTQVDPHR